MNFPELQEVIFHILNEPCPACRGNYIEKNIHILSTTQNEGVFFVACAACPSKLIINVRFRQAKQRKANHLLRKHRALGIQKRTVGRITTNDYLDMRNFLKNFKGNFKDYFSK